MTTSLLKQSLVSHRRMEPCRSLQVSQDLQYYYINRNILLLIPAMNNTTEEPSVANIVVTCLNKPDHKMVSPVLPQCATATSWYTVVRTSFCITFPCLKLFSISWIRSCMVISQFSTVHIVKSVQLHIFLCDCISWRYDNLVPAHAPI